MLPFHHCPQVLYRLFLAEKLKAPYRKNGPKRPDPAAVAARDAMQLEQQAPAGPLGLSIKILFMGLSGVGKTQLIHRCDGCQGGGEGPFT